MPDEEPQSVVSGDSTGRFFESEDAYNAITECPLCGGELIDGDGDVRLDDTGALSMIKDIDSGNKIEAQIRARSCPACKYAAVRVAVTSYAGY